jgi:[ribosomal protein S5]-alanine N-acetyltransferase
MTAMIKGKAINLRTVRQDDLEEILLLINDLSNTGLYWNVILKSEPLFKKRYQETGFWNDEFGTMIITDKNDRLIGDITYFKGVWYLPGYEVGYRIFKEEDRGKGYTTEALKIFVAYLFELKPINRIEIQLSKDNIPSRRVAEKCGFKYEGLKRQAVFSRGKYHDSELFSLIREECQSLEQVLSSVDSR